MPTQAPKTGKEITTISRELIPPDVAEPRLPFEDLVESLDPQVESDWTFRVYRHDANGKNNLGAYLKTYGPQSGPWPTLDQLRKDWGGGKFRIYGKQKSQLRYNETIEIAGEPLNNPQAASAVPVARQNDFASEIASQVLSIVREQLGRANGMGNMQEQAAASSMKIMESAYTSALNNIASRPGGTGLESVIALVLPELVKQMFAPRDHVGELTRILTLARELNPGSAAPAVDWRAAIAGQLPQIAGRVEGMFREWRMAREVEASVVLRRPLNPVPVTAAQVSDAPDAEPQNATDAPAAPADQGRGSVSIEFVERKIVEFVNDENCTGDEAAEWLDKLDPRILDQIVPILKNEAQRKAFFQSRPILAQIAQHPRLEKFLKEFLEFAESAPPAPQA